MIRLLICISVISIAAACSKRSEVTQRDPGSSVPSGAIDESPQDSIDTYFITYDSSRHSYLFPAGVQATELTKTERIQCDDLLVKAVNSYNTEATKRFNQIVKDNPGVPFDIHSFTIDFKSYGRQYVVVDFDGQKFVYVNCFCDPKEFNYRNAQLIQVDDGGSCYFNCKIDLKNGRVYDFMNGEA